MAIRGVVREETHAIVYEDMRNILREETRTIVREETRSIVRDEATSIIDARLRPIEHKLDEIDGRLTAIEADVKELYQLV